MNKINSFYITIGGSAPGISYQVMEGIKVSEITLDLHVALVLSGDLKEYQVRLSDLNGVLIPATTLPNGTYMNLGPDGLKGTTLNLSVTFNEPTPYKRATFKIELLKDGVTIESDETSFFIVGGEPDVQY